MFKAMMTRLGLTVATLAPLVFASSAQALTLSIGGTPLAGEGYVTSVSGTTTVDFNTSTSAAFTNTGILTYTGGTPINGITIGSATNQYKAPTGDTSPYLSLDNSLTILGGTNNQVTISSPLDLDYFGLYWGSVDLNSPAPDYNKIQFFHGSTLVGSFTGADIIPLLNHPTVGDTSAYVNFTGGKFNKIVLSANQVAFESDNHAYRVASTPEPGSLMGLLLVGGLGLSLKKSRD